MEVKTLIIGAGLSGLMLALRLSESRKVAVFEKSRGVGGRLATRRTDQAKFDHGAQFYRLKVPLQKMHERWLERGLVKLWFTEDGRQHFIALGGMTTLAKDLAQDTTVIFNERAVKLERRSQEWIVTFESGRSENANEVLFTCPVPQSLEILRASGQDYPGRLAEVVYSKALVLLIEESPGPFIFQTHGYVEPQNSSIFSIADQHEKGISAGRAITVTLSAEMSEKYFDAPEDEVIAHTVRELRKITPDFNPGLTQVKKWRYCQVQKSFGELYSQAADGLYLAGDGFGGASLNGAARSADALADRLIQRKGKI